MLFYSLKLRMENIRLKKLVNEKNKTISELEEMLRHVRFQDMMRLAVIRSMELRKKGVVQ